MSWKAEVDEIKTRQEFSKEMGGKKAVAKQHEQGRLTVRERIDCILDNGSFREIGSLAGKAEYDENTLDSYKQKFETVSCEIDQYDLGYGYIQILRKMNV